jgi:hypothetical protein
MQPVMFAVNTCPGVRKLAASTMPVVNVMASRIPRWSLVHLIRS